MRIVFMGTGEIALPSLRWLLEPGRGQEVVGVYTQPDKKIGRKQVLTPPEVKTIALAAGVPVFQPETFRENDAAVAELRSLGPDLLVVMAYGQILPRAVIDTPAKACVNLHASLLPRHRGASPIQAAIRDGDEVTGITLMFVVPKLDAGDMILEESLPIAPEDTGGTLHDRLADLGPTVLEKGLPLLELDPVPAEPQDESLVTYSGKLGREDGLVDWTRPAAEIERLVRAYDPWPGTSTTIRDGGEARKLKVFPPTSVLPPVPEAPGTVLRDGDGIRVACGEGSLALLGDLQLEGRRRLPVPDFLHGIDLPDGTRFS